MHFFLENEYERKGKWQTSQFFLCPDLQESPYSLGKGRISHFPSQFFLSPINLLYLNEKKITPLHLDLTFLNTAPGNAMKHRAEIQETPLSPRGEVNQQSQRLALPSHGNANPRSGFDCNTRLCIGGGDMFNSYINIKRFT